MACNNGISRAARAVALASRTEDAYAFDRYASWRSVAGVLLQRGYSEAEAEVLLRSKLMRWAADAADKRYGRASGLDLLRCIERWPTTVDRVFAEAREEGLLP